MACWRIAAVSPDNFCPNLGRPVACDPRHLAWFCRSSQMDQILHSSPAKQCGSFMIPNTRRLLHCCRHDTHPTREYSHGSRAGSGLGLGDEKYASPPHHNAVIPVVSSHKFVNVSLTVRVRGTPLPPGRQFPRDHRALIPAVRSHVKMSMALWPQMSLSQLLTQKRTLRWPANAMSACCGRNENSISRIITFLAMQAVPGMNVYILQPLWA